MVWLRWSIASAPPASRRSNGDRNRHRHHLRRRHLTWATAIQGTWPITPVLPAARSTPEHEMAVAVLQGIGSRLRMVLVIIPKPSSRSRL